MMVRDDIVSQQSFSSQYGESDDTRKKPQISRSFSEAIPRFRLLAQASNESWPFHVCPLSPDYVSFLSQDSEASDVTLVVIPSMDFDERELKRHCPCIEKYEERQLYNVLLLDNPRVKVVYVTSHQPPERFIRYLLELRGYEAQSDLRDQLSRLYVLCLHDAGGRCLSKKILSRPVMVGLLRDLIHCKGPSLLKRKPAFPRESLAGLSAFVGSESLTELSDVLGVALLEASCEHLYWGTKQGSRELFRESGIPFPPGTPDVGDEDLLTKGIEFDPSCTWVSRQSFIRTPKELSLGLARQLLVHHNPFRRFVCKLNMGFSGKGNAMLDLRSIKHCDYDHLDSLNGRVEAMARDIEQLLPFMKFVCRDLTWEGTSRNPGFMEQMFHLGVIAEAFVDGGNFGSPSIQAILHRTHDHDAAEVHIISTHDQILSDQVYEGCRNPASDYYREQILQYGMRVATALAGKNIVGHFSLDFIAVEKSDKCAMEQFDLQAVEINLRQGGTTHPHAILQLLTCGSMSSDGIFRTKNGQMRCYIATDTFQSENLVGMESGEFLRALCSSNDATMLKWSQRSETGVVFHLLSGLEAEGKVGFTAIGGSLEQAERYFDLTADYLRNLQKANHDRA